MSNEVSGISGCNHFMPGKPAHEHALVHDQQHDQLEIYAPRIAAFGRTPSNQAIRP